MGIGDFIAARLAERKQAAEDADGDWWIDTAEGPHLGSAVMALTDRDTIEAEVAALVMLYNEHARHRQSNDPDERGVCQCCSTDEYLAPYGWFMPWPCKTIRHLAASWPAHPDYQQEWRPT